MDNRDLAMIKITMCLLNQLKASRKMELEFAEDYVSGDFGKEYHYQRADSFSRKILKMEEGLKRLKERTIAR